MLDLRFALFAQYPAFFLLAVLFFINYLIVRKRSAVKSVLWVILFGLSLAVSILFCFLGMQSKYWTLSTLFTPGVWSWVGIALVIAAVLVRSVSKLRGRLDRRKLERELKKAEKDKDSAVAQAREEGRAEVLSAAQESVPASADAPAPNAEAVAGSPAESAES